MPPTTLARRRLDASPSLLWLGRTVRRVAGCVADEPNGVADEPNGLVLAAPGALAA
ncbi:hypothetical protein [Frankia sp. Cj3]|uniref:hypothetical protein n=1 Tax=Frankia sp. Cj3 TaxID=2880976 RepID=UPI001EF408B0|nr:hypothetical protein [Frankia sp. Cj3]